MTKKKIEHPIHAREQYYIKRGKKYFPVNDPGAYDGLKPGAWLVIVDKGCTSIRKAIDPKSIKLEAALRYLEDGLCKAISKASEMRPKTVRMSPKEIKAWDVYKKIVGKDIPTYFEFASHSEMAQKGCEYVRKIMLENNMDIKKIESKYKIKEKGVTNAILGLGVNE